MRCRSALVPIPQIQARWGVAILNDYRCEMHFYVGFEQHRVLAPGAPPDCASGSYNAF